MPRAPAPCSARRRVDSERAGPAPRPLALPRRSGCLFRTIRRPAHPSQRPPRDTAVGLIQRRLLLGTRRQWLRDDDFGTTTSRIRFGVVQLLRMKRQRMPLGMCSLQSAPKSSLRLTVICATVNAVILRQCQKNGNNNKPTTLCRGGATAGTKSVRTGQTLTSKAQRWTFISLQSRPSRIRASLQLV